MLISNLAAASPLQIFTLIVKQGGGSIFALYSTWPSQESEHEVLFLCLDRICAASIKAAQRLCLHDGNTCLTSPAHGGASAVITMAEGGANPFMSLSATKIRVQRPLLIFSTFAIIHFPLWMKSLTMLWRNNCAASFKWVMLSFVLYSTLFQERVIFI